MGEMFRVSLLGMYMAVLAGLMGARAVKFNWGLEKSIIRLLLGPSWFSTRVSIDVVGLGLAILVPRSFASDDLGRARLDTGRIPGGRMPLPTLIENEDAVELDVFLDWFELVR